MLASMSGATTKYAWLTVFVALITLSAKGLAAYLTGSVGLFSDALESIINLVTSLMLVAFLRIAKAPPDSDHPFGHDKVEYFVNGVQGTLILLAGIGIGVSAGQRFLQPQMLEAGFVGLGLGTAAGLLNFLTAHYIRSHAHEVRSTALQGEADHLMADVWTSLAVLVGVGLVYVTGLSWLDPLAALIVCGVILQTGFRLLQKSILGLMDTAIDGPAQERLIAVLERFKAERECDYHALRTRASGSRIFVSVHILVPGAWTVTRGHELLDDLEHAVSEQLDGVTMFTHLEPLEEECSFQDMEFD